ncbi:DUF6124 family protein [Pseudomonas sp. AU10]|uniref:DUF6124 family protein n=1 Tax=Pseudomonas sp. AU10 TaxID=882697 RepID=UPI00295ECF48|nr:DUF6124 family protein [Pseudomonas sp. AU10]
MHNCHRFSSATPMADASCYGSCARDTFGYAEFQVLGPRTCVQLPPSIASRRSGAAPPMYKVTPNPPPLDTAQLLAQASRAANHSEPGTAPPNGYEPLFSINSAADTEALLVNAYETLIGAGGLTSDLAETTDGKLRSQLLAIGQLLGLAGLLVDRAMEQRCPT